MSEANKIQIGGEHYKKGGEEHWDRVIRLRLNYFQAQITKYIERAPLKNGKQDVEKARHFCEKYIEAYDLIHSEFPPRGFENVLLHSGNDGSEPGRGYVAQGVDALPGQFIRVSVTTGTPGGPALFCVHGTQLNTTCAKCAQAHHPRP